MTIGERIRSSRINAGLTQKELGDKMGIDSATIGKYERGILNPKLQTLEKIAAALGVTVWELGVANSSEYRKVVLDRRALKYRESFDEEQRLRWLELEFKKLNIAGQKTALERIKELTEIQRFQKEKNPPDEMVWCGPSIPHLMQQYTMFTGVLPDDVRDFLDEHADAGILFVSADDVLELRAKLERKYGDGETIPDERLCYDRLCSEVGHISPGESFKYSQLCHTDPPAGDAPEDADQKKE